VKCAGNGALTKGAVPMKRIPKRGRKAKQVFEEICGEEWMREEFGEVMRSGKKALDRCVMEVGRMVAEAVMQWDREQVSGEAYDPEAGYQKWGWQKGSIYLGDQKMKVEHPRLRKGGEEVSLNSYEQMKNPGEFSEELLMEALRGMSARKYEQTVIRLGERFGISPSSISSKLVEATTRKLQELRERDLGGFDLFALFLDTVHRGGNAFVVALGIDTQGKKRVLGFWEGATENKEVCKCLLSDLESRGLRLGKEIIYVTDGGGGIIRALKDQIGNQLIHQRCTIHKDRNIQNHLPERYRDEAHRRYRQALDLKEYGEAKGQLDGFEYWLRRINESAADSLLEAKEELLTLHRLEIPHLLRVTLHSTNPIESVFSTVRHCEKNIKRYWGSKMSQRWLAAVALHAEESFRTVKGFKDIPAVVARIKTIQNPEQPRRIQILMAA